jgi:glycerophosphoryl diester phosphodiesterase
MRSELETDFFVPKVPRVMAHRGLSGLYPENTLLAFEQAVRAGAEYIELDVHMSRDGEVVVCHDAELERTTNRRGLIRELSYAEVAAADAGYNFADANGGFPFRGERLSIPRLAEVLAAFGQINFVLEIKQVEPSLVAAMSEVVEKAGMRRRVLIASEHQRPLDEARRMMPGVPTNFSAAETAEFFGRLVNGMEGYRPPGDALQIPPEHRSLRLVTEQSVAGVRALGLEMHVWTVNEPAEAQAFLRMGVHGIITDFPDLILALL